MLKLIKNFFAKKEKEEEKVEFSKLDSWLENKEDFVVSQLKKAVDELIVSINNEKKNLNESMKNLENAKLQNPNIPNRAKTVMEGNREAFIKKTRMLFENLSLDYNTIDDIKDKCKEAKKRIEGGAKSTQRSYTILNEFFARELTKVSGNIRNINNYLKDIENIINDSSLYKIRKLKEDFEKINSLKDSRKRLSEQIEAERERLADEENSGKEISKKIMEVRESSNFKDFEKLMVEKESGEKKLKESGDNIAFHFSSIEKALKKYGKIAFENGKLIESYLQNPMTALVKDEALEITKILDKMRDAIRENKLEMDEKKNEKTLSKLKELSSEYFIKARGNYLEIKEGIEKIKGNLKKNDSKSRLDELNEKLGLAKNKIESIKNSIANLESEIGKLDEDKLKQELKQNISSLNENVILA